MTKQDYILNLKEVIEQLNQVKRHLEISLGRCQEIVKKNTHTEEDLIEYEALTSRFARAADMLIHKVYRSIDSVELTEGGTLIDVLNRADKRLLIDSVSEMREIKDLRNDIAHEYMTEQLWLLHEEVFKLAPKLINLLNRANEYSMKYF